MLVITSSAHKALHWGGEVVIANHWLSISQ